MGKLSKNMLRRKVECGGDHCVSNVCDMPPPAPPICKIDKVSKLIQGITKPRKNVQQTNIKFCI